MSRIAKIPVQIVKGVSYTLTNDTITVKGPVGEVSMHVLPFVQITEENGALHFAMTVETREANANVGTMRALVNDMAKGCPLGYQKTLPLGGVGPRAQARGDPLTLPLGFPPPSAHKMPAGVKVETPSQTEIVIKGADKQKVGQTAAEVRAYRAPEPYKGKGVRYVDEVVVIKETKKK